MPTAVQSLSMYLAFLAVYAGVMSIPLIAIGLFAGPHIVIAGLIHAGLALVFFILRGGVRRRRSKVRRWAMIVGAIGTLALPIALWQVLQGAFETSELVFPALLSFLGAALVYAASHSAVRLWCCVDGTNSQS